MKVLRAIAVALGIYSQIPVPQVRWDNNSLRYAMCAFPLVGIIQGVLCLGWGLLVFAFSFPMMIAALGFIVIPLLVNGGIHLDGLSDTADALASNAPREKRLEILKDSHIGAFGVLALVLYMLALFSFFTAFEPQLANLVTLIGIFGLSRALSGWVIAAWPSAKKDGIAQTFHEGSAGVSAQIILLVQAVLYATVIVYFAGLLGLCVVGVALVVLLVYRIMAMRLFGGVTGDLAGWFLQMVELFMVIVLVIGGLVL